MGADDIKDMRAQMTADYAKGDLDGVTADDWAKIDQGLTAAETARRTQDELASKSLQPRGDDLVNKNARGQPVSGEDRARFELALGPATTGPEPESSTYARTPAA